MAVESIIKRSDLFPPSQVVTIYQGPVGYVQPIASETKPLPQKLGTATVSAAGVLAIKTSVTEGPFILGAEVNSEWRTLTGSNAGYTESEQARLEVPAASGVVTGTMKARINKLRAELGC